MRFAILVLILVEIACVQPNKKPAINVPQPISIPNDTITITNNLLLIDNGYYKLNKQLFSGCIKENYENGGIKALLSIYKGKQEGWTYEYFEKGQPLNKRYYHLGEKDSIHTAWWDNGNIRFIYHFKNGVYNGSFEEYYYSGKPLKKISYNNGNDSCGKGWRENGKLFMNYIMKDGRRFGLMNAQPCYSLKNEKGEYVK